jgi:hypothetical protein
MDKGHVGREQQRCRDRQFQKILQYKARFCSLPVEVLKSRLREFGDVLQQEAAFALRELLEEREQMEQESS